MESVPDAQTIQMLADQIRMQGYTILENALPLETLARIRERFDMLLEAKRAAHPANRGANRFQMHLPFEPPFADPLLYDNSTVLAILENLFGPDIILTYFASDTPFPGSEYQSVHLDTRLPFPEAPFAAPVYSVVVNAPLVDFTEENGPLELWPTTHLIAQPRDMEALAKGLPSLRPLLKAGSLLLRDARLWHRGTPNHGSGPRPNLALVYSRGWFRFDSGPYPLLKIPRAAYDAFPDRLKRLFRYGILLEPDGHLTDIGQNN